MGLKGTPLARYAFVLEAEGKKQNVNPFMIAAIAGVESSFGAAACGGNAWGIGSCSGSYHFESFASGIRFATAMLRKEYLAKGLTDIWSIGRVYCPPCGNRWGQHVDWFMRHTFGVPPTVLYPA